MRLFIDVVATPLNLRNKPIFVSKFKIDSTNIIVYYETKQ